MNHIDNNAAFRKISDDDSDIYDVEFNIVDKVTTATRNTLLNNRLGLAGSIAYIDNGAGLYENFKRSHTSDTPTESTSARLITTHKAALISEIRDIERLIIVGGGSYDSISSQELALVGGLFAGQRKPKLNEIVLIDVSTDFINECKRAISDFQAKHPGKELKVIPVRADFKDVTGDKFDDVLAAFGAKSRADTKAAVMMTGATFGNIESVATMDKFPGNEVDVQMANLADLVGIGSTVMFDHFTKPDTSEQYYSTPELSAFFNNIPVLMQKYCKGLQDFHVNGDNGQNYFRYRARQLPSSRMIAHELVAEAPQKPKIVNGVERVFPIALGDTLNIMFSLQARADDIAWRPVQNTGLESQMSVTHKDLQVMHVFKKVGLPGALHQDEPSYQTVDNRSFANGAGNVTQAMRDGLSRIIAPAVASFRPLILGGPSAQPA